MTHVQVVIYIQIADDHCWSPSPQIQRIREDILKKCIKDGLRIETKLKCWAHVARTYSQKTNYIID